MAFCFLPQFILLKSMKKEKYLRYRKEDNSKPAFLQFSGDEKEENPEVQYVKFEVQKSETMEGFVHIRSCYNNKYWVRSRDGDKSKSWIDVEANEAEEDRSKLSCTLFKPILVEDGEDELVEHDKPQKIRLVHVDQVGQQGCVALAGSDLLTLQHDSLAKDVEEDVFTVHNAASVVVLPNYVAFTNHEGNYGALTSIPHINGVNYVDFKTKDIGGGGVLVQLTQYPLASPPYIVSNHIPHGYWHLPSNSSLIQLRLNLSLAVGMRPIMLAGNDIALQVRNQAGRFANCAAARVNSVNMAHALGCSAYTISEYAIFGVHEPVLRREVSNVVYNLNASRVYNVRSLDKFRDERRNNTSLAQTGTFGVEYTTSQAATWSDSVSITTTISASMSVSVPYVGVGFEVGLSEEQNKTFVFGKEQSETQTVAYEQTVTIPPGKKITLLVVATRAQCDVPYSSRVVDTLSNGTIVPYTKNDGLFTGANEFSFTTELIEENL